MEYQTTLSDEKDNVRKFEEADDEPADLADRLYEEWRDEKLIAEASEA